MELKPGDKLGPYELVSAIGKGGMGEVWKARDTRLNRDVAIKTSLVGFSGRFQKEAEAIAALNHPNICTIYDVGPDYLVMEYIEGPTLSDRITRGPLALDEALQIAGQIASALEAAHEKSIVHRDLKPANIKIRPDGSVKVLDFGLAKAGIESGPATPDSPTMLSMAGTILGTAGYMSPEQARGQEVGKRSDIFAFGVVLYEMLTGRRLFDGPTISDSLAAVLTKEPDLAAVPVKARRLLRHCLEKDPRNRLRDIGDWGGFLDDGGIASSTPASRLSYGWVVAAAAIFAAAALSFIHFRETRPEPRSSRFQIQTPGALGAGFLALSPDGRQLAFAAIRGGHSQLWIRAMDTIEARALPGTEGASYPFWSPDGANLGFFAEGKLKKVAIAGGPPLTLCDATSGRGGTWNRAGVILFSAGPTGPIFRVAADGGVPSPVTRMAPGGAAAGDRFPVFLPDGNHFLYDANSDKADAAGVYVGSLTGAAPVRILPDQTNAIYSPPAVPGTNGHLLFRREDTLMAQPFDLRSLRTTGEMLPIAEHVPGGANIGFGAFSVSENGTLVYRAGDDVGGRELVWVDRAGKRLGVVGKPAEYLDFEISPDEKKVAAEIGNGSVSDIWLQDLARGVQSRFTFIRGFSRLPVWSPDGSRVGFSLQLLNGYSTDLYRKTAGGNGQEELLLHAGVNGIATDWSADGKTIVFSQTGQNTGVDLWLLPLDGERKPAVYLQTPFDESGARFSPDGKWMAYQSNESGQYQVYVQAIPPNGAKVQISPAGGTSPRWRRDGKELYYVSPEQILMAVPIKGGGTVEPGPHEPLFPVPTADFILLSAATYDVSRDGQRFLINEPAGGENAVSAPPVTVVLNWQAGLKK